MARAERQLDVGGEGRTLTVAPAGPYTSIAAALAVARDTDTILVQEGEYEEEPFALHGTQRLIGSDREEVEISVTGGTIVLQDSCRLEHLSLSASDYDDNDDTPLVLTTGKPSLTNVDIEDTARDLSLRIRGGALRARGSDLGAVEILGGAYPSFGSCELTSLHVVGAFPSLVDCEVRRATVVSDAGGGTFDDCRFGRYLGADWPTHVAIGLEVRDPGTAPVVRRSSIVGGYREQCSGVVRRVRPMSAGLRRCGRLVVWRRITHGLPGPALSSISSSARQVSMGAEYFSMDCRSRRRPSGSSILTGDRRLRSGTSTRRRNSVGAFCRDHLRSTSIQTHRRSCSITGGSKRVTGSGWRALEPPQGPNPGASGPFAAMNNEYAEKRLREYPGRAAQWAELRDDVDAGEYD